MLMLPLRLLPGADLRRELDALPRQQGLAAGMVVQGIGSLEAAALRLAAAPEPTPLPGPLEILSLAGTLSLDGAHLHMSLSDRDGRVWGGHVAAGCVVRTTVELLIALLPEHRFSRAIDPRTGYPELVIEPMLPDGAHQG